MCLEPSRQCVRYTCSSAFADVRVVLVGRAMRVRRLCCGSNISSLGWVGSFERVDMSSVPWKTLCLVASVVCFVVGTLGSIITHEMILLENNELRAPELVGEQLEQIYERIFTLNYYYEQLTYVHWCSPPLALLFIFLNRRKPPTSHNRLN